MKAVIGLLHLEFFKHRPPRLTPREARMPEIEGKIIAVVGMQRPAGIQLERYSDSLSRRRDISLVYRRPSVSLCRRIRSVSFVVPRAGASTYKRPSMSPRISSRVNNRVARARRPRASAMMPATVSLARSWLKQASQLVNFHPFPAPALPEERWNFRPFHGKNPFPDTG
jgi:hypothetical protein